MKGWISLHRKFLNWEWYGVIPTKIVFIHCLLKANFKDNPHQGLMIKRGSFVTSLEDLAKETTLTLQQVRTSLTRLQRTGEISKISTNKGTYITVLNYESYQDVNFTDNKPITNEQQTNNKRITTNNKDNNIIKELCADKSAPPGESKPKEKKKKKAAPRAADRRLISDVFDFRAGVFHNPPKFNGSNLNEYTVFWLWKTLHPYHKNKRVFRTAKYEKWIDDIKLLFGAHERNKDEFKRIITFTIENNQIAFIQSAQHFVVKSGANYDRILGQMEEKTRPTKEITVFRSKARQQ